MLEPKNIKKKRFHRLVNDNGSGNTIRVWFTLKTDEQQVGRQHIVAPLAATNGTFVEVDHNTREISLLSLLFSYSIVGSLTSPSSTLGSLSNDDGDGDENGKKGIEKQQLCTCITPSCTFLSHRCTTTM